MQSAQSVGDLQCSSVPISAAAPRAHPPDERCNQRNQWVIISAHQCQSAQQLLEPIHLMSDAISAISGCSSVPISAAAPRAHPPDEPCNQRSTGAQSFVVGGTPWSLEAIRGRQRLSEVIRGHQRSSGAIIGHQRSSEVVRGNPSIIRVQSEAIMGPSATVTLTKPFDGRPPPRPPPRPATATAATGATAAAP